MSDMILHFAYPGDLDTPTGGYRYDRRLIEEMRRLGIQVETLSLPSCLPALDGDKRERIRQSLAALPDQAMVIVDGLAFGMLAELAEAEAQRLRLVALCHHPLALETGLDEEQRRFLLDSEQRALACARKVLVTSPHTRGILVEQFAVPAEKIVVALPGTERAGFAACDGNPVRLLSVGSLIPRKGHDILIEALGQLQGLPWQARFVGGTGFDPGWAQQLGARIKALGLSSRIELAGTVADTRSAYEKADVFVLPSRYEGYGMVFAEALAAGLPIVASRAGAIPEVVPDSAGLLVAPDDADALGIALERLLTDQSLRRTLQSGARQAAAQLPAWPDTAQQVTESLKELY